MAVYRADLQWKGTFRRPSFADWGIAEQDVVWDEAELAFGVPDMRGLRRGVKVAWAGQELELAPGGAIEGMWTRGLRTPVPGLAAAEAGQALAFAFDVTLDGSRSLQILPLGKQTTVKLSSPWPDPSFVGAYLPESRRVGKAWVRGHLERAVLRTELPAAVAVGGSRESRAAGGPRRLGVRRRPSSCRWTRTRRPSGR